MLGMIFLLVSLSVAQVGNPDTIFIERLVYDKAVGGICVDIEGFSGMYQPCFNIEEIKDEADLMNKIKLWVIEMQDFEPFPEPESDPYKEKFRQLNESLTGIEISKT